MAQASFIISIFLLVKDVTLITVFLIKRFIDHKEVSTMRPDGIPRSFQKVEKEQSMNIQHYLIDPNDEGLDDEGNTSVHSLTKHPDYSLYQKQVLACPQMMFMLNR